MKLTEDDIDLMLSYSLRGHRLLDNEPVKALNCYRESLHVKERQKVRAKENYSKRRLVRLSQIREENKIISQARKQAKDKTFNYILDNLSSYLDKV